MPEPLGRSQRYMPGLDGLRAFAVAAVIGYHLGLPWLPGGLLGVGIFFTLSGYLITDLLLSSWEATGSLGLRQFWARRARRLLPALFVMLAVVSTWAAVARPSALPSLRGQVLAATLYVSNWWSVFQHVSYFARFGPPSPLGHLWSLAIEEQFYLLWPWLLWLGLVWAAARRRRARSAAGAGLAGAATETELTRPGPHGEAAQPLGPGTLPVPGWPVPAEPSARYHRPPALGSWAAAPSERELAYAGSRAADGYGGSAGLKLLGPPPALRRFPADGVVHDEPRGEQPYRDEQRLEELPDELAQGRGPDLMALGYLLSGRSATLSGRAPSRRPPVPPGRMYAAPSGGSATVAQAPGAEPAPLAREPVAERLARYLGVPGTRRALRPLAVAATVLAGASALEMALVYHPSLDPARAYDGTDTRAFALLLGAALALVWPSKGMRHQLARGARRALDGLGVAGLVVVTVLMCTVGEYSPWLYRGGMLLLSLATVAVVAAASHPAGWFGRLLGVRPLRWLGVRSYGVYLWHYPVIALTAPSVSTGFDLPRAVLQVLATLVLAELSWRFVESPVRRGALGRAWRELRWYPGRWARWARERRQRWLALGGVPVCVVVAAVALAGGFAGSSGELGAGAGVAGGASGAGIGGAPASSQVATPPGPAPATTAAANPAAARQVAAKQATPAAAGGEASGRGPSARTASPATSTAGPATRPAAATAGRKAHAGASGPTAAAARAPGAAGAAGATELRTSCKEVVHVGDSTSDSLVSPNYLPDPAQRLGAQYARVGVQRAIMRIEGGTSIVETLPGEPNAYQMAQALVRQGYHGCWVFALGTNDAADVYVGSNVDLAQRVREMMALVGNDPVLWVNVKTLVASGPYAEANMVKWDQVLLDACSRYPDMAVFNWAGAVQRSWFISDGIHYSSEGSAKRSAAIADALATAFPAGGPSGRRAGACVVNASTSWHLPNFRY